MNFRFFGVFALLFASLVLAGCNQRIAVVEISGCPAVGLLSHMSTMTRFQSERQTNADVVFDATMTNLDYVCTDSEPVQTEVSFSIIAEKGPASQSNVYELRYIVAVLRDNFLITAKETYTTQIRFAPGEDTTGVRETILQTIEDVEAAKTYDYEILIGFDLSDEELLFNVVR